MKVKTASELTETPPCPVCGTAEIPSPLLFERSFHGQGAVLGLSRCPQCRIHFARPRLVGHNLQTGEASYEYIYGKYVDQAEAGATHKDGNYRRYLELAERRLRARGQSPPYSVLDIGSHCGFFLRFAKSRGWEVAGVEPASPHVRFAREVNGIQRIHEGYLGSECFPGERFHLITMLDVLEHLADPVEMLGSARSRLHEGGVVLCKVPHVGFYLSWYRTIAFLGKLGILRRYSTYRKEPSADESVSPLQGFFALSEHVVHYDVAGVRSVFTRAGYGAIETLPAPPTNPPGHPANPPRSLVYRLALLLHALRSKPGRLTHGLIIMASPVTDMEEEQG